MRDLVEYFSSDQTTTVSFAEASVAQVIMITEFPDEDHLDWLINIIGTNDICRTPVTPETM